MGRWLIEIPVPFDPFQMVGYIPLRGISPIPTDRPTVTDPNARPRLPTHAQHTPGPHVPPNYSPRPHKDTSSVLAQFLRVTRRLWIWCSFVLFLVRSITPKLCQFRLVIRMSATPKLLWLCDPRLVSTESEISPSSSPTHFPIARRSFAPTCARLAWCAGASLALTKCQRSRRTHTTS